MDTTRLLVLGLAVGCFLPHAVAEDLTSCTVYTQEATQIDGFYWWGLREVWQESNGVAGLQRVSADCVGGSSIPPDTCITHTEDWTLLGCALGAPKSVE